MSDLSQNPKFLQKAKELSHSFYTEPVPTRYSDLFVARCWFKAFEGALNWAGFKIVPKPIEEEE